MKLKYITSKIGLLATFMVLLTLASCKDDYPEALDTSSNVTVLNSIKIVNAGQAGNTVLEGVVDENAKTVSFPRIDPATNFANIKFEANLSTGAKLSQESYSVAFGEGESEKVIVVKVSNAPRFREYLVKLRLKVPVFGADFTKPTTYDFTPNPLGSPIHDAFTGALTRGSGFDGEHVLVARREAPHLLSVAKLKAGTIEKIPLNMTGVIQGTFILNMAAQVNGHSYIANLSGNTAASPLKIYHWTNPSVAPDVIMNINVGTITNAGVRHGDNFSAALDSQGNGYFFFGDNAGTKVLRFDVANYTTVSNPTVLTIPVTGAGSWTSFSRIGNTSEYLFTGHDAPIALVSESGSSAFTMSRTAIPIRSSDARIVYFNGERYLIVTTAARTGSEATNFLVYDITKGDNVKDALTNLNSQPTTSPVFQYSLMGPVNTSPSSQTGFYVKKDGAGNDVSLMLYSGASDAGFVFFEFGKKEAVD